MASCNDDSGRPELTIQVAEDYYTNNLSGQDGFILADGFYSKQISEDQLNFEFSDDAQDGKPKIFQNFRKFLIIFKEISKNN